MSSIIPMLRLRRTYHHIGVPPQQSDELTALLDNICQSRQEFEDQIARMLADHRRQLLIEGVSIGGPAVAIQALFN